jgi:hypothetical protein
MFPDLRPCPHCRHQISPYKCYCPKCGKLAPDPPNRGRIFVGIVALVVVLIAGAFIYVVFNQSSPQRPSGDQPVHSFTP